MEMAMALQNGDTGSEFSRLEDRLEESTSFHDWNGVSWAVLFSHADAPCSRLSARARAEGAASTENADAGDHTGFSMVGIAG